MTNQRYIRLQEILPATFVLDAPVEIEKAALLLDTDTKSVLLQLRLDVLNCETSDISSITIKIVGFNDAGENVKEDSWSNYTFMDINLLDQKSFGDKTPIVLDYKIRKVKVEIAKVVFINGNKWHPPNKKVNPPKQELINSLPNELFQQFKRELVNLNLSNRNIYHFFPKQLDDYWLCMCGRPNTNQHQECIRCGSEKKSSLKSLTRIIFARI